MKRRSVRYAIQDSFENLLPIHNPQYFATQEAAESELNGYWLKDPVIASHAVSVDSAGKVKRVKA